MPKSISISCPTGFCSKLSGAKSGSVVHMSVEFVVHHNSDDIETGSHISGEVVSSSVNSVKFDGGIDPRMQQAAEAAYGVMTGGGSTHGVQG